MDKEVVQYPFDEVISCLGRKSQVLQPFWALLVHEEGPFQYIRKLAKIFLKT
jgi:hypothetical protein